MCVQLSSTCKGPIMAKGLCRSCYKKQYRAKNRERLNAVERLGRLNNLSRIKKSLKKYKYSTKGRYKYMQLDAKRRELDCTLTLQEYSELIRQPCYYCEKKLPKSCCTGLDRRYNGLGYIMGNVLPCCGTCNVLRGNKFTVQETKVGIMAIMALRSNK